MSFPQLFASLEQREFDDLRCTVPRVVGCPPLGKTNVGLVGVVPVPDRSAQPGGRVIESAFDVVVEDERSGPQRVPVAREVEQLAAEGRPEPGNVLVDPESAPAGARSVCSGASDDFNQLRPAGIRRSASGADKASAPWYARSPRPWRSRTTGLDLRRYD